MGRPVHSLLADMTCDGTYDEDLTPYANSLGRGWQVQRGMGDDGTYQVSQMRLGLDNTSGRFTPTYQASPLFGLLRPDVPIVWRAEFDGRDYTLWAGYISEWNADQPILGDSICNVQARDLAELLAHSVPINVTVSQRTTGAALDAIATSAGLTADDVDFDAGRQTLPVHFSREQNALDAGMQAVSSELGGRTYIDGRGRWAFRQRDARVGVSRVRQQVLRTKPAGYWRMGAASGSVPDETGHGLTATATGSPVYDVPGLLTADIDTAVGLVPGSYFSTPDHARLDAITTGLTVLAVFELASIQNANVSIVDKGGGGVFFLRQGDDGEGNRLQFFVSIASSAEPRAATSFALEAGQRYIVLARYDGENLTIRLNGETVAVQARTGTLDTNNSPLYLGAGQQGLDGTLDDVAVWDRALTDAECEAIERAVTGESWLWGLSPVDVRPESKALTLDPRDVVTSVSVQAQVYVDGDPGRRVFWFARNKYNPVPDSIAIGPGETYGPVSLDYDGLADGIISPVAGIDYEGNTSANGTGTDRTSSLAVAVVDRGAGFELTIRNTHSSDTVYLTQLQIRGDAITEAGQRPVYTVTHEVPGIRGRSVTVPVPFADDSPAARDYAVHLLSIHRYPAPRVELTFPWASNAQTRAMLMAEIGDLVWFDDTELGERGLGLRDWFYVERVAHTHPMSGEWESSTVMLVPSYTCRDVDSIVYDAFNRPNASGSLGISLSGDDWSGDSGFNITSGAAAPANTSAQAPHLDVLRPDMAVQVGWSALGSGAKAGVVYRYVDSSNYCRAYVDYDAGKVVCEKVVSGSASTIDTAAWTPAATAEVLVIAQGERHRVWVDFRMAIDATDVTHRRATRAGLFAEGATASRCADFRAEGM